MIPYFAVSSASSSIPFWSSSESNAGRRIFCAAAAAGIFVNSG